MKDQKRRLFIDPASISTGWALYIGDTKLRSGTIKSDEELNIDQRLYYLGSEYFCLLDNDPVDEVHIEQLFSKTNVKCHWSVGAIMYACSRGCSKVYADVVGWQKSTNYQRDRDNWKKLGYSSEDEMAAVLMGKFWVNKWLK